MEVYRLAAEARLLMGARFVAVGVWGMIQRGRGSTAADVKKIMAELFPGDAIEEAQVKTWLRQIVDAGIVQMQKDNGQWRLYKGNGAFALNGLPKEKKRKDAKPASPTVLLFPTRGTASEWALTQAMVDEWVGLFPGVDVLQCCRGALAWVLAEVRHQKTSRGMRAFLVSWLNRQVEINSRGGGGGAFGALRDERARPRGDLSRALAEFGAN